MESAIKSGSGDCFVIAGIESMSHVPMGGFNPSLNPKLMEPESAAYIGMGTTAENLAKKFSITREEQDKYPNSKGVVTCPKATLAFHWLYSYGKLTA